MTRQAEKKRTIKHVLAESSRWLLDRRRYCRIMASIFLYYIFSNCGHARTQGVRQLAAATQGVRQLAAAKPPLRTYIKMRVVLALDKVICR